ncbi:hypothetical protein RFI_15384, partial [Reticulomyxa filosa]
MTEYVVVFQGLPLAVLSNDHLLNKFSCKALHKFVPLYFEVDDVNHLLTATFNNKIDASQLQNMKQQCVIALAQMNYNQVECMQNLQLRTPTITATGTASGTATTTTTTTTTKGAINEAGGSTTPRRQKSSSKSESGSTIQNPGNVSFPASSPPVVDAPDKLACQLKLEPKSKSNLNLNLNPNLNINSKSKSKHNVQDTPDDVSQQRSPPSQVSGNEDDV